MMSYRAAARVFFGAAVILGACPGSCQSSVQGADVPRGVSGSVAQSCLDELNGESPVSVAICPDIACEALLHAMMDSVWHLHARLTDELSRWSRLPMAEAGVVRDAVDSCERLDREAVLSLRFGVPFYEAWPNNYMGRRVADELFLGRYSVRNETVRDMPGVQFRRELCSIWGDGSDQVDGMRPLVTRMETGELVWSDALFKESAEGCLPDLLRAAGVKSQEEKLASVLMLALMKWPDYQNSQGLEVSRISTVEMAQLHKVWVIGGRAEWNAALQVCRGIQHAMGVVGVRPADATPGPKYRSVDGRLRRFWRFNVNDLAALEQGCVVAIDALARGDGVPADDEARYRLLRLVASSARLVDSTQRKPVMTMERKVVTLGGGPAVLFEWVR